MRFDYKNHKNSRDTLRLERDQAMNENKNGGENAKG